MTKAYSLLILAVVIFLMGSLMVYNTTSAEIIDKSLDIALTSAFVKQLFYAFIGLMCAIVVVWVGIDRIMQHSGWIMLILTAALLFVFIPGIGMQLNGAKRWIKIFGVSFQPSEFVKVFLPLFVIRRLVVNPIRSFSDFLKVLGWIMPPVFLILIEPDNGSFVIMMTTLLVVFYLFNINKRYWLLPFVMVMLVACALALNMPHVSRRIEIYIHPEKDLLGKGHQPYQAKIAVGSGSWLGRGLGNSLQKLTYLPEARSDYIAAIYAEETGFIGALFLITLYFIFAYLGAMIALAAEDLERFSLGMTLLFLVCFQVFLNLGVVSGLLPSKGTNLPFFSQGGSSLVANSIIVGMFFSLAQHRKKVAR
jgi:cell division protein FtsW